MSKIVKRIRNKVYIRIPFGEIQYGKITKSILLFFRGKKYWIKRPVNVYSSNKYLYKELKWLRDRKWLKDFTKGV